MKIQFTKKKLNPKKKFIYCKKVHWRKILVAVMKERCGSIMRDATAFTYITEATNTYFLIYEGFVEISCHTKQLFYGNKLFLYLVDFVYFDYDISFVMCMIRLIRKRQKNFLKCSSFLMGGFDWSGQ